MALVESGSGIFFDPYHIFFLYRKPHYREGRPIMMPISRRPRPDRPIGRRTPATVAHDYVSYVISDDV